MLGISPQRLGIRPPCVSASLLWTPDQLGDNLVKAYYNPANTNTLTIATGVSQMNDISGNAHNITQGTGSKQPASGTRDINGVNVLDYIEANSQSLFVDSSLASYFNTTNVTFGFYAVCEYDSGTTKTVLSIESSSSGTPLIIFRINSSSQLNLAKRDNVGTLLSPSTTTTISSGTPTLINCQFDGTNVKLYINGNLEVTSDLSTGMGALTLDRVRIGSFREAAANYFDGKIGTQVITDGTETADQRQLIEGSLANLYGIQGSLVAGHPYKTYAPTVGNG